MKRVITVLFALLLVVGALFVIAGCSKTPPTPEEMLDKAFSLYGDAIDSMDFLDTIQGARANGMMSISINNDETSASFKYSIPDKTLVVTAPELGDPIGINFDTCAQQFQWSAFGLGNGNILEINTEEQEEIIKSLETLKQALDNIKTEDKDFSLSEAIKDYTNISAEYDATTKIDGQSVEVDTVTVTMTKAQVRKLVEKWFELSPITTDVLESMMTVFDEEMTQSDMIDDIMDEVFGKYSDDDTVVKIVLALDKKYGAALQLDCDFAGNDITVFVGTDPKNISKITVQVDLVEAAPTEVFIIIAKSATTETYTLQTKGDDGQDVGMIFEIDKAHKTINAYEFVGTDKQLESSMQYEKTDDMLKLIAEDESIGGTIEIAFYKKSDIGEYRDIMKMSYDEIQELMMADDNDDIAAAQQYLEDKYDIEVEFDDIDDSPFTQYNFNVVGTDMTITVARTIDYLPFNEKTDEYFTEEFIDNGYVQLFRDDIIAYFEDALPEQFGAVQIDFLFDANVCPSEMDGSLSFVRYMSDYADYLSGSVYIITGNAVTEDDIDQVYDMFDAVGFYASVEIADVND